MAKQRDRNTDSWQDDYEDRQLLEGTLGLEVRYTPYREIWPQTEQPDQQTPEDYIEEQRQFYTEKPHMITPGALVNVLNKVVELTRLEQGDN